MKGSGDFPTLHKFCLGIWQLLGLGKIFSFYESGVRSLGRYNKFLNIWFS